MKPPSERVIQVAKALVAAPHFDDYRTYCLDAEKLHKIAEAAIAACDATREVTDAMVVAFYNVICGKKLADMEALRKIEDDHFISLVRADAETVFLAGTGVCRCGVEHK